MQEIKSQDARDLIDRVGPSLGYDHTYDPTFPEGRKDVCVVSRLVENGRDYGYDVVYLVWADENGKLFHKRLADTRVSKDYIQIGSFTVDDQNNVVVELSSGGSFSGNPWKSSVSSSF